MINREGQSHLHLAARDDAERRVAQHGRVLGAALGKLLGQGKADGAVGAEGEAAQQEAVQRRGDCE